MKEESSHGNQRREEVSEKRWFKETENERLEEGCQETLKVLQGRPLFQFYLKKTFNPYGSAPYRDEKPSKAVNGNSPSLQTKDREAVVSSLPISMHSGQIIMLTKMMTCSDLRFYGFEDGVPVETWRSANNS